MRCLPCPGGPPRQPDPTILFAPTYNPEISAAALFEGRLVPWIRRVFPESRILIKPHPAILDNHHPDVQTHQALFKRWVRDWRDQAGRDKKVTLIEDSRTAIR